MPARRIAFAIVAGLAVLAAPTATKAADHPTASTAALGSPRVVASGLNVPWGIAFLPNGDALVSERATGRIKRIPKNGGTARTVKTIPGVAKNFGEGGLLYTGSLHQLGTQALGVFVVFTFVFTLSFATFWLIKKTYGLRVSAEEEEAGLDITEHGMYGYPEQFIPAPELVGYSPGPEAREKAPAAVATGASEVTA